jgi:hypothetical protein
MFRRFLESLSGPAPRDKKREQRANGARELFAELKKLQQLRQAGRIIELDYSYMPTKREFPAHTSRYFLEMIGSKAPAYLKLLNEFAKYKDNFAAISINKSGDEKQPFWSNGWLPLLDAICLYGLIAKLNPRRYIEIGSGNSTKFVRRAINDHHLQTRIISIDPSPRTEIDDICDEVIREKLEVCNLEIFAELGSEDILFIDSSHRSFQNSDVTVVFTEILPALRPGCMYGFHDIFLPNDYPAKWHRRFYNEQYLLMAYLLGGAGGDSIVCPVHYIELQPEMRAVFETILDNKIFEQLPRIGGAFWMRRAAAPIRVSERA